mgnify:CR=1 FL=1
MRYLQIAIFIALVAAAAVADYSRDFELARRYKALGKVEDARDVLEPYLEEHSSDPAFMLLMKEIYRSLGDNEALLGLIESQLVENPQDASLWAEAGGLHLALGNTKEAEDAFENALEIAPRDKALVKTIFHSYRSWGYTDEAIDILQKARKESGSPGDYALDIATIHEIRGDWVKAADEYALYLEQYPDRFPDVERRMNEVAADAEQLEELEKAVTRLRDQGVQGDRIDRLLARLQIRQGEYGRAVESLIDAEEKRGRMGMYLPGFMTEARDAGAHEAVIRAGEYLSEAAPEVAHRARLLMARSYRSLGDIEQAAEILSELIESKQQYVAAGALVTMGEIELYDRGDDSKAEDYFQSAIEDYSRQPASGEAFRGLAELYIRRGDLDSAGEILLKRREVAPEDPWAIYALGEIAFYRGSMDTAGAYFRGVALGFPKSPEANEAVLHLALLADASQSEYLGDIAEALKLRRQGKTDEALEHFDSLVNALENENWLDLILFERAQLYRAADNPKAAKADFERIAEDFPEGYHAARSLEILGDMALKGDDPSVASQYYSRILTDYPDAVNVGRVRAKLREVPGNI